MVELVARSRIGNWECARINVRVHTAQTQDVPHIRVHFIVKHKRTKVCVPYTAKNYTHKCAAQKWKKRRRRQKGRKRKGDRFWDRLCFENALKTKRKLQTLIKVLHSSALLAQSKLKYIAILSYEQSIYIFVHCLAICVQWIGILCRRGRARQSTQWLPLSESLVVRQYGRGKSGRWTDVRFGKPDAALIVQPSGVISQ